MIDILRVAVQAMLAGSPPRRTAWPYCAVLGVAGILVCLLAACGLLLTSAWLFLLPHLGLVGAPLALAAAAMVLAAMLLVWLRLVHIRPKPAMPLSVSAVQLAPLLAEAERMVRSHKLPMLSAALLAGVLAGSTDSHSARR